MKEHPILFSTPMVQAILDGRKSMTRRVMKPQPPHHEFSRYSTERLNIKTTGGQYVHCPYGQPGDRLWVRETWCDAWDSKNDCWYDPPRYHYRADGYLVADVDEGICKSPWRPSIFIPKAAARICLEVVNVRVERVQEISEEDAKAEGFRRSEDLTNGGIFCTARENFEALWNTLNAKRGYGWDANPWVWVIEFKRIERK